MHLIGAYGRTPLDTAKHNIQANMDALIPPEILESPLGQTCLTMLMHNNKM